MNLPFRYDRMGIDLTLPEGVKVYVPHYPASRKSAAAEVFMALVQPIGTLGLEQLLTSRRHGEVVVVVSDITRPIPYSTFLSEMLETVEGAGVPPSEIVVLVATGMHRPSTEAEKLAMFGERVVTRYRVVDHRAEEASELATLPGRSASGAAVQLNKRYVEAGFRITTGLVEPHFMAGFSGGRKAICPGLASLDTVRNFHGSPFLANPLARNANLVGNPLHDESLSVAKLVPPDFTLNLVLDAERRLAKAFAGELEAAHAAACDFVRQCACPIVQEPADLVVTSSGGHPLDTTFYQCVKGFVSCLPAVREGGTIVAMGGCTEGIGSPEFSATMERYAGKWSEFLRDIREPGVFTKDQWQFQMHARALEKIGEAHLHFVTHGLNADQLARLSVTGHSVEKEAVKAKVEELMARTLEKGGTVAAFPEGPYCVPVAEESFARDTER